ncbi:MAG: hypothetical protein H0T46_18920 [Deltaproteobacteria bacterium]|nr:hypothetical protein [Deltaproteobacteria bacterium]
MRALVIFCLVACGGKRATHPDDERNRMEHVLRRDQDPTAVATAAREYRELMAEKPDALRLVAQAYSRIGDRRAAIDTLTTLISRGQATRDDRFRAIELLLLMAGDGRTVIDEATYRTNLEWMHRELRGEPECSRWMKLVDWTQGRSEELASIDAALAVCKREGRRGQLFQARAKLTRDREDACQAIVRGTYNLEHAQQCADGGTGWQVEVAKALLGQDPQTRLMSVLESPEITSFVLALYADTPGVEQAEACKALKRALGIEFRNTTSEDVYLRAEATGRFESAMRRHGCS